METKTSEGKEIKIPGPDHPITISPAEGKVRVTVAGKIVAESAQALRLEEKGYPPVYYLPRNDADLSFAGSREAFSGSGQTHRKTLQGGSAERERGSPYGERSGADYC